MKRLTEEIVSFFKNQNYVIVSTVDAGGTPHASCKGIVRINRNGRIYLIDLYRGKTHKNLLRSPRISVTAVDEHKFRGYCLKGEARTVKKNEIRPSLTAAWEKRITGRITQRLLRNVLGDKGHGRHPEASLPGPSYMIVVEVTDIVNLTPHELK